MATLAPDPRHLERPRAHTAALPGRSGRAPWLLGSALLATSLYAVFAHGAIAAPAEPRVEVALELIAALALAAGIWSGSIRLRAPRAAGAAVALLGAFAVWSAISLGWSVAPDGTWLEFNRVVSYLLAVVLALALGASLRGAVERVGLAFLGLVALVVLYGLGQKLLPGIDLLGLVNLDQTGAVARLQEPIGYWNALALLLAMGAPVALAAAGRQTAPKSLRLAAVVLLELILLAGAFTVSRGGTIALVVALAAVLLLGGGLLRLAMWLGAALLAALPAIVLGLSSHALSADHVALARRESAGLLLLVVLVACAVVLVLAAERLIGLEAAIDPSPSLQRRLRRATALATLLFLIAGALALASSTHGLSGSLSHALGASTTAPSATSAQAVSVSSPNRLLSTDSTYRVEWWKEALGAFSARPLTGWGAGSFATVHLLFRRADIPVTHAHSVPLQWLAETGLVGALLAIGAWGLLLRAGFAALRRSVLPGGRMMGAAVLGAGLAYTVHALVDWDWDIPGVTLPVLILLGVLAGADGAKRSERLVAPGETRPAPVLRLFAVVAGSLAMCALALSSVLPSVAAGRASSALVAASGPQAGGLLRAQRDGAAAAALDPLSDAGPLAEASIALRLRDLPRVRAYLLQAVHRVPADPGAWERLAITALRSGRAAEAFAAANRLFELDPFGSSGRMALAFAQEAALSLAPPRDSATAGPTP